MTRYWGQPYEGSDDEVNDMIRIERKNKDQAARSKKIKKTKNKAKTPRKK